MNIALMSSDQYYVHHTVTCIAVVILSWQCTCMCRSPGRIVEALVEDFLALAGSGLLTVTVQNVGPITSDYSVSA